uniref:Uncharacterized protein LOC117368171 n=1 Tax=Geotrypetes seraphini TaxID=260995 RepID=A0A6P8SRE5_GEOSA|nr:uncharacterized protein LOC117368171 [Geotrypetes seraphini]XP_033817442.1 uncharacterized protein LOC117368171 [Geotrypetes seraphini]
MAPLHSVVFCFLFMLMFIASSVSPRSTNFSCPSPVHSKVGDSVQLVCSASDDIQHVILHNPLNSTIHLIDTYNNKYFSEDKRISLLQIEKSSATLQIDNVKVSDANHYTLFLQANGGYKTIRIELKVEVPYSNIIVTKSQDAIVCKARGGSSEGQIRWLDGYQKNWTKSAEMVANKMEDGTFLLTSILYLKSYSIMEKYCCTVEYKLMGTTKNETSCITTNEEPERHADNEESRKMHFWLIIPVLMFFVALVIYCRSGQRHFIQGESSRDHSI